MAINIHQVSETIVLNRYEEWDEHVKTFHLLTTYITSYESSLSPENKVLKLIRTLQAGLASTVVIAQ